MILIELDNELGGLILKHKEMNKSALALKYGVDRHIKAIEAPTESKLRECGDKRVTIGDERYFYYHFVYKMPGHLPGICAWLKIL